MTKELEIKKVDQKIWTMFDDLKVEPIAFEDYYVVLYFLSLYKDDILSKEILKSKTSIKEALFANIASSRKKNSKHYLPILEIFKPIVFRMTNKGVIRLIETLFSIDNILIVQHYQNIFESTLIVINFLKGWNNQQYILPQEISRLSIKLAELPDKANVFNPFAGLAPFGITLEKNQKYIGQELNPKTFAIGTLRLIASNKINSSQYTMEDTILQWPSITDKFDLIISNPPINKLLGGQYKNISTEYKTITHLVVEKGLNSLKQGGKLILILPHSFLSSSSSNDLNLKKRLINEDLLDTIISLPRNLVFNDKVQKAIFILCKKKKTKGKLKLIDATSFVKDTTEFRKKVLDDTELFNVIQNAEVNSNFVRITSNITIDENNFDFNFYRYFKKSIEGVKLGEILKEIKGSKVNPSEEGKQIRIRDLKNDNLDYYLDNQSSELSKINKDYYSRIDKSCLLLAMAWNSIKPTYFEFSGDPIYINQDIVSFEINESIADISYIINELHSTYVEEQLEGYRIGLQIPHLKVRDLLEVVIDLPSLKKQKAKVKKLSESRIKKLRERQDKLEKKLSLNQYDEIASLKHTLGRPRQNILDWSDNLLHFLNTNQEKFSEANGEFKEFYKIDITSALKEIKRDVNFITEVLEKGENGLILENFETKAISLTEINKIIQDISGNSFNFKIKKLFLDNNQLEVKGININSTLLKTLLDNLLTNANKHGFETKKTGNEVVIELKEVDNVLSLVVKNNGKPFPKNFNQEKFITKYTTANIKSGTGLGGYDIHRIATYFNCPDWELILNEDPFYPVIFKFKFRIEPIN